MKKYLLVLFTVMFFALSACGGNNENAELTEENQVQDDEETAENEKTVEEKEVVDDEQEVIEEESNDEIELSEQLMFGEFTIDFKKLLIDDNIAKIEFNWINQAGRGTKQLMNLTLMTVKQNDEDLNEINDAWTDFQSDVFKENAEGGELIVNLEYELIDDSPLTIKFQPLNELNEEPQEITIELN